MQIKLWDNFNKTPGSTKVPSGGNPKEVEITNAVSIMSPVIKLDGYHTWNYAYIPNWDRYYFVSDIGYEHGFTYLYLQEDVLASNRQNILGSSQYVTRAAKSTVWDDTLIDSVYPSKCETKHTVATVANPFTGNYTYIVQLDGADGAKTIHLGETYYNNLVGSLWQGYVSSEGITESWKYIANPTDNIRSIKRTRYQLADTHPYNLYVGAFTYGTIGDDVTGKIRRVQKTLTIPKPSDNRSKHTSRYSLSIPGSGVLQLSSADMYANDNMMLDGYLNMDTGTVLWKIRVYKTNETSTIIAETTGKFALPVLVDFQNINLKGLAGDVLSGISSASMGNTLGLASGVVSGLTNLFPTYSSVGECSDWAGMDDPIRLDCAYQDYPDLDITHNGKPTCKVLTLSTLSGYTQCENVIFSGATTQAENAEIKNWLESGVYIE